MTAVPSRHPRSASECIDAGPDPPDANGDVDDEQGQDDEYLDELADLPDFTTAAQQLVPAPPDGGWGWVVVFASFMANAVLDGICYTFGVFIDAYSDYFRTGQAGTSVAGSLLTGVYLMSGPVVGGLVNKYGSRMVLMVGSVISCISFFISVYSPQLIHFILIYGFFGGLGFGMIFLPAIVHVNYYFERKRALATGIAVAGSGFGTIVMAPFATYLISEFNWKGAHWILAGLILNCMVFGALMRPLALPNAQSTEPVLRAEEKPLIQRIWEEKQRERLYFSQHSLQRPTEPIPIPGSRLNRFSRQQSAMSSVPSVLATSGFIPQKGAAVELSSLSPKDPGLDPADLADALTQVDGQQSPPKRQRSARGANVTGVPADKENVGSKPGSVTPPTQPKSPSLVGQAQQGLEPIIEGQIHETKPRPKTSSKSEDQDNKSGLALALLDSNQQSPPDGGSGDATPRSEELRTPTAPAGDDAARNDVIASTTAESDTESPTTIRNRIAERTSGQDGQAPLSRSASRHHPVASLANSMQLPSLATSGASLNRAGIFRSASRMSRSSRISAQTYQAYSGRIPVPASQLSSRQELPSTQSSLDPADFQRPMYRADIFYSGSIQHLPEFRRANSNIATYRQSITSLPHQCFDYPDGRGYDLDEGPCPCLPPAVRDTVSDMIDFSLLRDPVMFLMGLSSIIGMLGFYVPFIYLVNHASAVGVPKSRASLLLSVIGFTNTLGRVFFGWFSDRNYVKALTLTNVTIAICGVITILGAFLTSFGTLATYAALYGFMISAYVSLTSIVLVELFGLEKLTSSFGLICLFRGCAAVASTPLAGTIVDATGRYVEAFVLSGCLLLACCGISCLIYVYDRYLAGKNGEAVA